MSARSTPTRGAARSLGRATYLISLLTALALGAALPAQPDTSGTVTGRVSFARTGEYLERARLTLDGTERETFTDALGAYTFTNLPVGDHTVRVFSHRPRAGNGPAHPHYRPDGSQGFHAR
jgi:hypothetical protein